MTRMHVLNDAISQVILNPNQEQGFLAVWPHMRCSGDAATVFAEASEAYGAKTGSKALCLWKLVRLRIYYTSLEGKQSKYMIG